MPDDEDVAGEESEMGVLSVEPEVETAAEADVAAALHSRARRVKSQVAGQAMLLRPFAEAIARACATGGRVLLAGEGSLAHLAAYAAPEVVGRTRKSGVRIPAEAVGGTQGGPGEVRIGGRDVLFALLRTGDDPALRLLLEHARGAGAEVLAICVGPTRVERLAARAIDIPDARPDVLPGVIFATFGLISKIAVTALVKRRVGVVHEPESQLEIELLDLADATGESARVPVPVPVPEPEPEPVPLPVNGNGPPAPEPFPSPLPDASASASASASAEDLAVEEVADDEAAAPSPQGALIRFACDTCAETLLAGAAEVGKTAACPFCGGAVEVPAGACAAAGEEPGARAVTLKLRLDECHVTLAGPDGRPRRARLVDIVEDGVEVDVEADALAEGAGTTVRLEAPAFLEPLVAPGRVERVAPAGGSGPGAARAIVRLEGASRDVLDRLARLAELAIKAALMEIEH